MTISKAFLDPDGFARWEHSNEIISAPMPNLNKPGRPARGNVATLNINIDPELSDQVRALARANRQTLRVTVELLLESGLHQAKASADQTKP